LNKTAPLPTTPESQKTVDDLALSAHVQAILIEEMGLTQVEAHDGIVSVTLSAPAFMQKEMASKISNIVGKIAEVKKVEVSVSPPK